MTDNLISISVIVELDNQICLHLPSSFSYKHFITIIITLSLYRQMSLQLEIISQVSCDPVSHVIQ